MTVINIMDDRISILQLTAFEAAVRHGSFTGAARELGLSQPALSHRIQLLESGLGRTLFTRRHRGVALTADGEILQAAVTPALARIREAVERLRSESRHPRVRISLDFAFGSLWLMPRLARYGLAPEAIDLQISSGHRTPARHLQDGDIAFVLADPAELPRGAHRLFREAAVPVCSPDFLARHPEAADAGGLLSLPLIHNGPLTVGTWLTWRDWAGQNGLDWRPAGPQSEFTTYPLVLQAALAGRGLALGWQGLVDDMLANGQLVTPCTAGARSSRWYCAVLADEVPAAARDFLAAVARLVRREARRPGAAPVFSG